MRLAVQTRRWEAKYWNESIDEKEKSADLLSQLLIFLTAFTRLESVEVAAANLTNPQIDDGTTLYASLARWRDAQSCARFGGRLRTVGDSPISLPYSVACVW